MYEDSEKYNDSVIHLVDEVFEDTESLDQHLDYLDRCVGLKEFVDDVIDHEGARGLLRYQRGVRSADMVLFEGYSYNKTPGYGITSKNGFKKLLMAREDDGSLLFVFTNSAYNYQSAEYIDHHCGSMYMLPDMRTEVALRTFKNIPFDSAKYDEQSIWIDPIGEDKGVKITNNGEIVKNLINPASQKILSLEEYDNNRITLTNAFLEGLDGEISDFGRQEIVFPYR